MSWKEKADVEKGKLKELSFKGKLQYLWDYYKFVLIILIVIALLVWLAVDIYKGKQIKTGISVMALNTNMTDTDESPFTTGFANAAGFEVTGEIVEFDASSSINLERQDTMTMSSITKVMAVMSTGDLDLMIVPEDLFQYYSEAGAFMDWKDILAPEDYEKYKSFLVTGKNQEESAEKSYGIRIEDSKYIKETGLTSYTPVIICPVISTKRPERAADYVKFLLDAK